MNPFVHIPSIRANPYSSVVVIISHSGSYRVVMHKNRGQLACDYIHVKHATGHGWVQRCYTRLSLCSSACTDCLSQKDTHKIDSLKSLQKELGGTAEQLFPIIYTPAHG